MNNLRKNLLKPAAIAVICFLFILASAELYARAGGGGGGGGGGGDGDSLIGIIVYILFAIPFPWNFVVIGILILLGWLGNKKKKQQTVLNQLPKGNEPDKIAKVNAFIAKNPNFNLPEFKSKVNVAFLQIQDAWMKKNMGTVRKYISDGMYQRMNTQFKMMNILNQTNAIISLQVNNIAIDNIETDGEFDIIHAAVHASINDKFTSEAFPNLNSGGFEEFVEYWTFVRRKGIEEKNMFNTNNCPKCGAELPQNAGEVSRCDFCKTITNLGDYDWVLSEITQAEDYISQSAKLSKQSNLTNKMRELLAADKDFSVQTIEDKASNGYLQICTAKVLKDPKVMRRFVTDQFYEKSSDMGTERMVYNRLYLNDVTLIGASLIDNKHVLYILVKSSLQRVMIQENKAVLIDAAVTSKSEVIAMERDVNPGVSKGSLYAHTCPSCAGPVKDTLDITCQYCGATLNSSKNEWIISDIMSTSEYKVTVGNSADFPSVAASTNLVDGLFDVRDIAFNNVLVIMAADGAFSEEEQRMAQGLAKKWGYSSERISPMFIMAKNKQLVIRMPDDAKRQGKIFKLMEKAASVDGISVEEKNILDSIKAQYGIAS